jgi:hypothetical protein
VLFAVRVTEDGWVEYVRHGNDGQWHRIERIDAGDHLTTRTVEVSADGRELYWLDSRGRDTAALTAQDLASGAIQVLAEDPHADFAGLMLDPVLDHPIAAVCARERQRWLARLNSGELSITALVQIA